jgi:S1-C subfamily serine protease
LDLKQTIDDVKKKTVKIIGDGSFCGTGFFYKKGYCITCHHVIYKVRKIQIEYDGQLYDTEWSKDYSSMEFDIAVFKVRDLDLDPLLCAKETTPTLDVSIWGFTKESVDKFSEGKEFSGIPY